MINLGDRAKDTITGFEGIVISKVEHLQGCVRVSLQPEKLTKDGKPIDQDWFDESQVELVEAKAFQKAQKPKHGPRTDPSDREDPS